MRLNHAFQAMAVAWARQIDSPRVSVNEPEPCAPPEPADVSGEATEKDLVAKHVAGDKNASAELLNRFEPVIRQAASRHRSSDRYEDILQELRLSLFDLTRSFRFDDGSSFVKFAYRALRIRAVNYSIDTASSIRIRRAHYFKSGKNGATEAAVRASATISLSSAATRDDETYAAELQDSIPDNRNTVELIDINADLARLADVMSSIEWSSEEATVIRRRLLNEDPDSSQIVGEDLGISHQQVLDVERDVVSKIARRGFREFAWMHKNTSIRSKEMREMGRVA